MLRVGIAVGCATGRGRCRGKAFHDKLFHDELLHAKLFHGSGALWASTGHNVRVTGTGRSAGQSAGQPTGRSASCVMKDTELEKISASIVVPRQPGRHPVAKATGYNINIININFIIIYIGTFHSRPRGWATASSGSRGSGLGRRSRSAPAQHIILHSYYV